MPADDEPILAPDYSDTDVDTLAEEIFDDNGLNNIIWEGPDYPKPKKLYRGTLTSDPFNGNGSPLAVFTADSSKAHGYAISEPANATANAQAQVARLKAKYE